MTRTCPQHCGRLVTAAVFISIGIVQLIAGAILFRSEYVYLLSGPNIWTAVANISGGGLLGLSAGIWERISKSSPKHALRRNILAALVSSIFLLNTTTAIILILGEGNTLLSIQLENSRIGSSANFSREILAYAYSASVCSPIICIVVATAFLAEILFPKVRKSFRIRRVVEKDNTFSWVYKTEHGLPTPDPEILRKALTSKSSSSTSSDDSTISPPIIRRKLDVESSMATRIGRLESHQNHAVPLMVYREPKRKFSNYSTSRIGKSRVSFVDDYATNDKILQEEAELGDLQDRMKPDIKRRGNLFALSYESLEDPNQSISSGRSRRPFQDDVQYSTPDVFESFQENLQCHHPPLRKTSTTTTLNHPQDVSFPESSSNDHSNLHATLSGASSNGTEHDLDRFNVSTGDDFIGEVVPIRINTLPRNKLPSKLVPVEAPVVSSVRFHSLKRAKTSKFKDVASGGTSSFKGGREAKHRSKSTGSCPEKPYETIPHESRKTFSFEASAQESSLQQSPAHTSGYMSSGDDNFDLSLRTTDSFLPNPTSPGCSSSHFAAKRKKFRKRNVQDEELTSKTEAIDDVVKQMIIEKISIEELYRVICKRRALRSP